MARKDQFDTWYAMLREGSTRCNVSCVPSISFMESKFLAIIYCNQNLKNQMICIVGITMEQILPTQLWQKKVKDDTVNIDIQNTYNQLLTASSA